MALHVFYSIWLQLRPEFVYLKSSIWNPWLPLPIAGFKRILARQSPAPRTQRRRCASCVAAERCLKKQLQLTRGTWRAYAQLLLAEASFRWLSPKMFAKQLAASARQSSKCCCSCSKNSCCCGHATHPLLTSVHTLVHIYFCVYTL